MSGNRARARALREKAAALRRLSGEYFAADYLSTAAKLSEVAMDWEARAAALEGLPC